MKLFKKPRQPEEPAGRRRPGQATQGQAFSYYAARSQGDFNVGRLARAEQPSRKQPRFIRRLAENKRAVLVGVALLIFVLFNLQLTTTPKIVALTDSADESFLRDTGEYKAAAQKLFEGSAANRNKLTVNAPAIAATLQSEYPELRDVSVTMPFLGDQPVVYIQPSQPAAVLSGSTGSFVLDENGRALIQLEPGADVSKYKVPIVVDQSRLEIKAGTLAIPRTAALFINTVVQQLKAANTPISRIILPADGYTLNIYITGKSYYGKFNLRDDRAEAARLQAGTFVATAAQLAKQGTTPGAYIDVRVPGRAYYK